MAVVGAGLYFLINKDEAPIQTELTTEEPAVVQPAPVESTDVQKDEIVAQPKTETNSAEELNQNKVDAQPKAEKKSEIKSSPLNQPSVEPYDPTKELEQASEKPDAVDETDAPSLTNSSIAVVTDNTDKKLNFHYQFKEGKLYLLGSFERDLYEILEFFSNSKRTIFLYYNSNYYLLDESQLQPTPLNAITDQSLLQQLKASRGKYKHSDKKKQVFSLDTCFFISSPRALYPGFTPLPYFNLSNQFKVLIIEVLINYFVS